MADKTKTIKQIKSERVARTVKVSTLVKVALFVLALAAVFVAGYFMGSEDVRSHNHEVKSQAVQLLSDLKESK